MNLSTTVRRSPRNLRNTSVATKLQQEKDENSLTKASKPDQNRKRKIYNSLDEPKIEGITSVEQALPWYNYFTKSDPIYDKYMREEWGFEVRGDQKLFEKLCLEGAQSGLSWRTILNKREAYKKTFHGFDIEKVASMTQKDVECIINAEGTGSDVVVKHQGKIQSVINNAIRILEMKEKESDLEKRNTIFTEFLWSFVNNKPILNGWNSLSEMPGKSLESEQMSKALKKLGFKFVGPTTCYSLMQSMGFVIDHPISSLEWEEARQRLMKRPGGFDDRTKGV